MNYTEFKQKIINKLKQQYFDKALDFRDKKFIKNNVTKEGLYLYSKSENISPVVYLDDLYKKYQDGYSLDKLVMIVSKILVENKIDDYSKYNDISKTILIPEIINKKLNQEMLKNCPHYDYLDLSVVFRCLYPESTGSSLLTYSLMEMLNLCENDLYSKAMYNLIYNIGISINTLQNKLEQCVSNKKHDFKIDYTVIRKKIKNIKDIRFSISYHLEKNEIVWCSTTSQIFGASILLDKVTLKYISALFESDIYIIPSSIHELLIVSVDNYEANFLKNMLMSANTKISEDEILSTSIYKYDRLSENVTICHK